MTLGQKEKQTKSKRATSTRLKKTGKEKNISNIKLKTADFETFKKKCLSSDYNRNTDSYVKRKQSWSADIGKSSHSVSDLDKSYDSQSTISEEMTETEFTSVMSKSKSEKSKRRIVRTSSDSEDFISPTILKSQSMHKSKKVQGNVKRKSSFRFFFGFEITGRYTTSVQIHLGYKNI